MLSSQFMYTDSFHHTYKTNSFLSLMEAHCVHCEMQTESVHIRHTDSLHTSESFLRSWPVLSESRNSPHFMEPEGSLPHSQVPATCPYPEPARSVHTPTFHFLKIHLNVILPSTPGSSKWSLSLRFLHQNPVSPLPSPIRATCPAHPILLDFITRTILSVRYRSPSYSLCSFLHSPVTSSLLGPNILLNTLFSNTLSLRSSLNVSVS